MASAPSVSIRKSIRWGDGLPLENTSTVVLTTRAKNYVDVRVFLPEVPEDRLPNDDCSAKGKLEWAFAGQSCSTPARWDGPRLVTPQHSRWTHWIDSQKPAGFQDEGYMYAQYDGLTLEKGIMENPETGIMTPYEEVWEDIEPQGTGGDGKQRVSVTLRLNDSAKQGMIIRVGDIIQGMVKTGDEVTAERWHWTETHTSSGWKRILRIGFGDLPCSALFDDRYTRELQDWEIVEEELF